MRTKIIKNLFCLGFLFYVWAFYSPKNVFAEQWCPNGIDITVTDSLGAPYTTSFNVEIWLDNPSFKVDTLRNNGHVKDLGQKVNCGAGGSSCSTPANRNATARYSDPVSNVSKMLGLTFGGCTAETLVVDASAATGGGGGICGPGLVDTWTNTTPAAGCTLNGTSGTSISGTPYTLYCCMLSNPQKSEAVMTAIGLIGTEPAFLVKDFLSLALGFLGGITLLLFLFGTIRYITSNGSPDAVAQAKGIITAAITGTAVIVLAVLLLGLLGVNVIGIPGWRFNGTQLETPN